MEEYIKIIKKAKLPIILVDLSWVLYKSSFIFTEDKFKTTQGIPNGHLLGLTNLLKTCYKLGHYVFICEDGNCTFRKEQNSNYKSNRESKGFYKQLENIENLVNDLPNTFILKNSSYEADDILFSAAKIASENSVDAYIHTADKDLYQAIDEHVKIASKITLTEIQLIDYPSEQYVKNFPVCPSDLPIYRAFKGDASDNLPIAVPGMRTELILDLVKHLSENGNLANYQIKKKSHEKYIKHLIENYDVFKVNYSVMKLCVIPFELIKKNENHISLLEAEKFELSSYKNFLQSILLN